MPPNIWRYAWMALLAFALVYGLGKLLLPRVIALVNARYGLSDKQHSDKPPLQNVPESYFAVLVSVLCLMVGLLLAVAGGVFVGLLVLYDYLFRANG